jgi:DNA repair exonuclease SbcCD ATPase subunit
MYISFKKIKFRNILSYGNAWTEFEFKPGLNLIKAQNGSGKSAIIDAMTFALFGKPYRDIKLMQLINNINDAGLEVVINFSIGDDEYEITRGLKPSKFAIKKNGDNLELLSSKKLNQDEIDRIIGIDYNLYKNIVCIASINNKSFLALAPYEKRALIESIFNINLLAIMLTEVKKRNTFNKTKQKTEMATYDGLMDNILTTTNFYKDVNEKQKTFEADKLQKIMGKRKSIDDMAVELQSCVKNLKIGNAKEVEFEQKIAGLQDITTGINEDKVKIKTLETEIKNCSDRITRILSGGAVCPLCGSELCNEHSVAYRKEITDRIDACKTEINSTNQHLMHLKEQENSMSKYSNLLGVLKIKNIEQKTKKEKLTENIALAEEQIKEIENSKFTVDVETYKNKLNELKNRKEALKAELDEIENELMLESHLIRTLGEYGVRQHFFNKLLPILNAKVNHYLNLFELPVSFEFDNTLNAKITRGSYEMCYEQFSCGEKQRIDMSILLSFFDISKNISNWSCSVLFLDEILDSGVDNNGLTSFISVLNNIVHNEEGEDLGVYLISHKLAESSVNFDNIIEITKQALFSKIEYANEE